ncbi:hypothetical protein ABE504_11615 [Paenibacillus oryzisoli]
MGESIIAVNGSNGLGNGGSLQNGNSNDADEDQKKRTCCFGGVSYL